MSSDENVKLLVGLTGGIGAGKSLVASLFKMLGVPVFDSDTEAKKIMNSSPIIRDGLINLFGRDVYRENGALDRKKLAEVIFNEKIALKKVNELVHPEVGRVFIEWSKMQDSAYVIQESAILFENNLTDRFDYVITVSAPREIRIKRVLNRDHVDRTKIEERINNQIPDERKLELSDFCIFNDEKQLLIKQVIEINRRILEEWENLQNG